MLQEGKLGLRPPGCSARPGLHGVLTQQPGTREAQRRLGIVLLIKKSWTALLRAAADTALNDTTTCSIITHDPTTVVGSMR